MFQPSGNTVKGMGDNEDILSRHSAKGSDWGCGSRRRLHVCPRCTESDPRTHQLGRLGRGFQLAHVKSSANAQRVTPEAEEAHGLINARDLVAQKMAYLLHPPTALATFYCMPWINRHFWGIPVHERIEALSFIHDGKRCHG